MENIRGVVVGVLKETDRETGAVFFRARLENNKVTKNIKVGGYAHWLDLGDSFVAHGEWKKSFYRDNEEMTFRAIRIHPDLPTTIDGMKTFMTHMFDIEKYGVNIERIEEITEQYGLGILGEIKSKPHLLISASSEPKRLGAGMLAEFSLRLKKYMAVRTINRTGMSKNVVDAIINSKPFTESADSIYSNPWRIARVDEVGFENADNISLNLGFSRIDNRRFTEAILSVLKSQASHGSTTANLSSLFGGMSKRSRIDNAYLMSFLEAVIVGQNREIIAVRTEDSVLVSQWPVFTAETGISNFVKDAVAKRTSSPVRVKLPESMVKHMDDSQKSAVAMALSEPLSVITGGPGTGKSTILRVIADLYEKKKVNLLLAAPTGKAAKRMEETTGRPASTVHRMLRASLDGDGRSSFAYNKTNPMPSGTVVIVDEASMLDSEMAGALVNAIPEDGRLVLVGDKNQLPSVGPGDVLGNLLAEHNMPEAIIPRVELTRVYRQAGDSAIATGASLIRNGIIPDITEENVGGVSFIEVDDELIGETIEDLLTDSLRSKFDISRDVVVLSPMAPGPGGTWNLNRRLSALLNKRENSTIPGIIKGNNEKRDMPIPRVGDRIMLTENDSVHDVMNGDTGIITGTGKDNKGRTTIKVTFDCQKSAEYPVSRWRILIPAYAMTIHKSQGSQYPVVIMPFARGHESMMERKLIYTGWTRAQSRLILVGNRRVFEAALANQGRPRETMLDYFLTHHHPTKYEYTGGDDDSKGFSIPNKTSRRMRSLIFTRKRKAAEHAHELTSAPVPKKSNRLFRARFQLSDNTWVEERRTETELVDRNGLVPGHAQAKTGRSKLFQKKKEHDQPQANEPGPSRNGP